LFRDIICHGIHVDDGGQTSSNEGSGLQAHLIARHRFNAVIQSIFMDTWPGMMSVCFPEASYRSDKANYFISLPNGSEIWFGGLDDKERTEKILGTEYVTIFLNECSQIGLAARNMVLTRLAQRIEGLELKAYYDENPPMCGHWTHRLFLEKREPTPPHGFVRNAEAYAYLQLNPVDNAANLPATYLAELEALPPRERLRFLEGRFGEIGENALWNFETIETYRKTICPDLRRVIVAVDPSGTKGMEGDTVGIIVAGLGLDGEAYIIEDCSVKAPPDVWGRVAVNAYDRHAADALVAEVNFGGAMVEQVVKVAASNARMRVNFKEVSASRGKAIRAEPIAALYSTGKVHHVGHLAQLEDQMIAMTTAGYMGEGSPDRLDACVWALAELFPRVASTNPNRSNREWGHPTHRTGTWEGDPETGVQRQISYKSAAPGIWQRQHEDGKAGREQHHSNREGRGFTINSNYAPSGQSGGSSGGNTGGNGWGGRR
jgi:predicted phage terminase large subunit-like protein